MVEDWATESLLAARQAYQAPETGKRMKSGQKLAMPTWGEHAGGEAAALSAECGWRWFSMRRSSGELVRTRKRKHRTADLAKSAVNWQAVVERSVASERLTSPLGYRVRGCRLVKRQTAPTIYVS